jgi:hypothetical protein
LCESLFLVLVFLLDELLGISFLSSSDLSISFLLSNLVWSHLGVFSLGLGIDGFVFRFLHVEVMHFGNQVLWLSRFVMFLLSSRRLNPDISGWISLLGVISRLVFIRLRWGN